MCKAWRQIVLVTLAAVPALGLGCARSRERLWGACETHTVIQAAPGELGSPIDRNVTSEFGWTAMGDGSGMWETSATVINAERFDEALVSANMEIPDGAGAAVDIQVGTTEGAGWSPWLRVASWGEPTTGGTPQREFLDRESGTCGKVDVDYFTSSNHFGALRYRVRATTNKVQVKRVSVCRTDSRGWLTRRTNWVPRAIGPIDVPFRSQKTPDASLSGRLCSPTSVAMVLAYRGVDAPIIEVAKRAHDANEDIYGNWPRNIQAAYALGVPGYLTRIDRWETVERCFHAGQPIIASIITSPGELVNAPYAKTAGHLIVLRGFDGRGGVYVNDPASPEAASGQLVYSIADLTNVWMYRTGGTAYILLDPLPPRPWAARLEAGR